MKNLGLEISQESFHFGAGFRSAKGGEIAGQVLGQVNRANPRGSRRTLKHGVVRCGKKLRLVGPKEYGPNRFLGLLAADPARNPALNGSLPNELKEHLGELPNFVEFLDRQIQHDDFAVEGIFRAEIQVGAKQPAEKAAQEAVSHAGEGADNDRAGFLGQAGKFPQPVITGDFVI